MNIPAQGILEQVRFVIETYSAPNSDKPADVLRLSAAALLRQACDLLDSAEEAGRE